MMDIFSERGQKSLQDEQVVARWVERNFAVRYLQTPKDTPATVDAIIIDRNILRAVVETKCRYDIDSLEMFREKYNNEWLITWQKVHNAIHIGASLGVPCVGFLFIVRPQIIVMQKLSAANGALATTIRLETTSTQATINGGKAIRINAFVNMGNAKVFNIGD